MLLMPIPECYNLLHPCRVPPTMHTNLKFTKSTTSYSMIQVTAYSQLKNFFISICKLQYICSAVCITVCIEKQADIWSSSLLEQTTPI
jgi:hypothetical protein